MSDIARRIRRTAAYLKSVDECLDAGFDLEAIAAEVEQTETKLSECQEQLRRANDELERTEAVLNSRRLDVDIWRSRARAAEASAERRAYDDRVRDRLDQWEQRAEEAWRQADKAGTDAMIATQRALAAETRLDSCQRLADFWHSTDSPQFRQAAIDLSSILTADPEELAETDDDRARKCPKCAHLPSERRKACPHEDCPAGEYAR